MKFTPLPVWLRWICKFTGHREMRCRPSDRSYNRICKRCGATRLTRPRRTKQEQPA